jgi:transposase-like protein
MPSRNTSPWAFEDSELECPRCHSKRVTRVLKTWSMRRGIQTFECHACGKKFVLRDVDDYSPLFE